MNANTTTRTLSALFLLLSSAVTQAQTAQPYGTAAESTSDWTFSAGAAVAYSPRYAGASKKKAMAIPTFDIRYRDWFFINPFKGIGAEVELLEGLKGSASIGASFDERKAKDDARLNGLGDIGVAAATRLEVEYELDKAFIKGKVISRLGSSKGRGTLFEAEVGYNVLASRAGVLALGLEVKAMDNTYARNFFGVSAQQSAASGLPVFNAKSGVAGVGPFVQAVVPVTDRWTFFGRVAYNKLRGDAAASPITVERNQPFVLATVIYKF